MNRRKPLQWMILGTGPAAAKTCVSLGLCKLLGDRSVTTAPFKAIAVIRPDAVPSDVDRLHRAPGVVHQIGALGIAAEAVMNPVAVWQVEADYGEIVVMGEPIGTVALLNRDAIRFDCLSAQQKVRIGDAIRGAYAELCGRFEAIVIEGAGSPVETPEDDDWANQRLLRMSGAPAVLVARFSNGGAAGALVGTLHCLGPELRSQVIGLVLSDVKDRDSARHAALLATRESGVPVVGIIPRLRHGVDGIKVTDYSIAYSAWAEALAAHVDLRVFGAPFAGSS